MKRFNEMLKEAFMPGKKLPKNISGFYAKFQEGKVLQLVGPFSDKEKAGIFFKRIQRQSPEGFVTQIISDSPTGDLFKNGNFKEIARLMKVKDVEIYSPEDYKSYMKEDIAPPPHATKPEDNDKDPLKSLSDKEKKDWMDVVSKNQGDISKAVSIFASKYPHLKDQAKRLSTMKKFLGSDDSNKYGAE